MLCCLWSGSTMHLINTVNGPLLKILYLDFNYLRIQRHTTYSPINMNTEYVTDIKMLFIICMLSSFCQMLL